MGYVLVSPSGKAVEATFHHNGDEECWVNSFAYLYGRYKWMAPYWKQWDESMAAASKRGWRVAKAKIVLSE